MALPIFVTYHLSHTSLSHAIFHTPSFTHNFHTRSLSHTPSCTHHLSHTIFHTPSLSHTIFVTHHLFTHHLRHTSLPHTSLTHIFAHQSVGLGMDFCVCKSDRIRRLRQYVDSHTFSSHRCIGFVEMPLNFSISRFLVFQKCHSMNSMHKNHPTDGNSVGTTSAPVLVPADPLRSQQLLHLCGLR